MHVFHSTPADAQIFLQLADMAQVRAQQLGTSTDAPGTQSAVLIVFQWSKVIIPADFAPLKMPVSSHRGCHTEHQYIKSGYMCNRWTNAEMFAKT